MKRLLGSMLFVGIVSGCVSVDNGPETGGARPHWGKSYGPPTVPGVEGPYGTPVGMAAPYNMNPPGSEFAARQMMSRPVPMDMMQMNPGGVMGPSGVPLAGGMPPSGMPKMPPGMMPPGMGMPGMMPPGMGMPGMMPPGMGMPPGGPGMGMPPGGPGMGMPPGGPGMGMPPRGPSLGMGMPPGGGIAQANFVSPANGAPGVNMPGGATQAQFSNSSPVGALFPAQRTQVTFSTNPAGVMKVLWSSVGKDGKPSYSNWPLETPGKYNFAQGAIYRLKLTHIPGHPGLELYPTLEVVPTGPKTNEFLAHNSVPLVFTDADFKQVIDRNYIVKVVYLPDPQFQDSAASGPDEIDSRRLEPGQDPIQEALRRGSILLVVRIGNIDQEVPNTPSMTAPPPGVKAPPLMSPPGMPGGFQVPYFGGGAGPNVLNPNLFPAPNGVGSDTTRKPPVALPPLPPLPGDQGNRGPLVLPFEQPGVPSAAKKEPDKLAPFAPLPPMPELKLPIEDMLPTLPTPNVLPQKDIVPPLTPPKKTPAPVSNPNSGIPKEPTMPELTIPPIPTELPTPRPVEPKSPEQPKGINDRPYELPTIPLPTLPMRNEGPTPIAPTPISPTSTLPNTLGLPPLPEFNIGSDLPVAPPPPMNQQR